MPSIFSRIIARELPAEIVFETEHELAFLDLHPQSPGHLLVVPKEEVANFGDLPPERAASLARTLRIVARGIVRSLNTPHYNIALNNGSQAGQVVFHVHFHIIPQYEAGTRPEASREALTRRISTGIKAELQDA